MDKYDDGEGEYKENYTTHGDRRAGPVPKEAYDRHQWVIALKDFGHLPANSPKYAYFNVFLTEEEYQEVLEQASL